MLMAASIAAPQLTDPKDGEIQRQGIFKRAIYLAEAMCDLHLGPETSNASKET
jgi:hypothetical protein